MSRLSKAQRANLTLAELSIKLTESIIRLADALTLKVENIDVLDHPPDVSDRTKGKFQFHQGPITIA